MAVQHRSFVRSALSFVRKVNIHRRYRAHARVFKRHIYNRKLYQNNLAFRTGCQRADLPVYGYRNGYHSFPLYRRLCSTQTDNGREFTSDINGNGSVIKSIIKESTQESGELASQGLTCDIKYTATLDDGTQFDSSDSSTLKIGSGGITGWSSVSDGIVTMKAGEVAEFVIPPNHAYRDEGSDKVPSDATLTFRIELISIHAEAPKMSNDQAVPEESIDTEGPNEGDPWIQSYDKQKKRVYYHHPYTQEAFWIAPTSEEISVEKAPLLRRLGAALVDTTISLGVATVIGIAIL